jgi:hypothetical protein
MCVEACKQVGMFSDNTNKKKETVIRRQYKRAVVNTTDMHS